MPTIPPSSAFQEDLEELINSDTSSKGKVQELMNLLKKARKTKESPKSDEDCPDPDEDDCRDILSPCCGAPIRTVFGTLPVDAECQECGGIHRLSQLVAALPAA